MPKSSSAARQPSSVLAFAGACLALLTLAAVASANLLGYTDPIDLSEAGENASKPQVAVDPQGRATVAWERWEGSNVSIQAVRLGADGVPGTVHTLSEAGQQPFDPPQVAVDPQGRATVVWHRFEGSITRIQAVRLDAAGDPEHAPDEVHTLSDVGQSARNPQVAVDPQGRATVVWRRSDDSHQRIQAVRLDAAGDPEHAPDEVHTLSEAGQHAFGPQVAVDPDGRATVAWERDDGDDRIQAVRLDAAGDPEHAPHEVHTLSEAGEDASRPQVAVDPDGRATVVWRRSDGSHQRIQAVRLDAAGDPEHAPHEVHTLSEAGRNARDPQVVVDPDGRATVAWERRVDGDDRIQAVRLDANGVPGTVHTLSEAAANASKSQVAVDPQGRATVAWQRDDGDLRIQAIRLDANGVPGTVHTLSEAGQSADGSQVAVAPDGRATVVWQRWDGSHDRVQASRSVLADPPPPANGDTTPPPTNGDTTPPPTNGDTTPPPPPPADPLNLPAQLVINRAQVRVGASAAQRHGVRRLVVRGALNAAAAGERVVLRFRAAGRQIVMRPLVQENGRFAVNRRLRGPQRRVGGGQLRLRYRGNETLRAAGERLRAARRAVRLRIARLQVRGSRLVVAGNVRPRARRQARILVEFNRPNGDPAQVATRVRVNPRGRFRTRLQAPPAVRNLGAWVSITHPGRARLFGQRRGQAVGG